MYYIFFYSIYGDNNECHYFRIQIRNKNLTTEVKAFVIRIRAISSVRVPYHRDHCRRIVYIYKQTMDSKTIVDVNTPKR